MMLKKILCLFIVAACQLFLRLDCRAEDQSQKEISPFFDDVLLIINFNHPYYDNIDFLKQIYAPYFKNIVFYGENPHPGVNVISHFQGWYVHRALSDAMKRWPNYKGYICCQDDCFMNFWNYPRLDKNKIWLHQYWTASLNMPTHPTWPWWNYPCGHAAAIKAYTKLSPDAIVNLEANCGPQTFAYSWADFFYIPNKYRNKFIQISKCFNNPDVFLEISIPTIIMCLEKFDRIEHLNAFWGGSINSINLNTYQTSFDWIHPIKLSDQNNRQFIQNLMINISTLYK